MPTYRCPNSSFSMLSTYLRCSDEFAKLPVLIDSSVCWTDKEGGGGGGVDLVTASSTLAQITSSDWLLMIASSRGRIRSTSKLSKLTSALSFKRPSKRVPLPFRHCRIRAAGRACKAERRLTNKFWLSSTCWKCSRNVQPVLHTFIVHMVKCL